MGFKLGAIVGFGAGYYLGAKAGRERYELLNRWADKVRQTDAYGAASAKARGLADDGIGRAKDMAAGRSVTATSGSAAPAQEVGSDPTMPDVRRN